MSTVREVIKAAILEYIQEESDPSASEVLKVYEEVHHALLEDKVSYGAADRYFLRIIYRRSNDSTGTLYYEGTLSQLVRDLVGPHEF